MKAFFTILCIVCILIPVIVYGIAIAKAIQFNANCLNYLEMAANANSVQLAHKHLTTAINYLESHNLTSGNTKIFIYNPTRDIGFWYENLKSAQTQLEELSQKEELTDLEESNALMKLRETLLDENSVTYPDYISFYPAHVGWCWTVFLIWLLWGLALFFGFAAVDAY